MKILQKIPWNIITKKEIDLLFPAKIDVNKTETDRLQSEISPLVCAIVADNVKAVEALLEKGADPNRKLHLLGPDSPPIGLIDSVTNLNILKLLIKHGAKVTKENVFHTMCQGLYDNLPEEKKLTEERMNILLDYFDLPNNYSTALSIFNLVNKVPSIPEKKEDSRKWQECLMELIADSCAQEKDKTKRKKQPLSPEIIRQKRTEQFIKHLF